MKIGIDTRILTVQKTGVGNYISNLVPEILNIDKENEYILFGTRLKTKTSNYKFISISKSQSKYYSILWKTFKKPKIERLIGNIDLLFYPNFTTLPSDCSNIIPVVHDLSYMKFPQYTEKKNLSFLKKELPLSLARAKHIIAVSENTKKDIISYFNIRPEIISVIYEAVSSNFFQKHKDENFKKIKEKYGIKNNYILFVGTLEPRKNIEGIIKAYTSLLDNIKEKYDLVLAGGKGWQDQEIFVAIEEAQRSGNRIFDIGYVPEEDLPALYSGASLFCYPSFYEGFGIPILEAMACGTPVITSNISSMPEVAGDAALLVNPLDIEEIKESIIKIINDSELRASLIEKGRKQIQKFSWTKSAEKLIKVFEKVYKA